MFGDIAGFFVLTRPFCYCKDVGGFSLGIMGRKNNTKANSYEDYKKQKRKDLDSIEELKEKIGKPRETVVFPFVDEVQRLEDLPSLEPNIKNVQGGVSIHSTPYIPSDTDPPSKEERKLFSIVKHEMFSKDSESYFFDVYILNKCLISYQRTISLVK